MPKPETPNFGVPFPPGTPLIRKHLWCSYHNRGKGTFYHRREIIRALWPDEVFKWHEWSNRRLAGTCKYELATWVGAGATGKSTDAAAQAIAWWLEAPFESAVIACSTTIKMLRLRIWSEIARLFYALPKMVEIRDADGKVIEQTKLGYVGELVDSDLMIRWKAGDNKHAIFGMGVNEGSVQEAISNLVGVHAKRLWLMLDELQGIREAIDGAKDNMSKNATFRCLQMGNTDQNMKSLLRRAAEPIGGWNSVDVDNADQWESDGGVICAKGIVQRFDGRKSPAIKDPARFPFLINQRHIDSHIRKAGGNLNDPGLCSQCFAIWPQQGLQSTVLDQAIIDKFRVKEKAVWTDGFSKGAALDPAFTEGGDRKILQFFKFSQVTDDEGSRWVIEFGQWIDVPIDATSEEPIHYQIANFCKDACEAQGIGSDEFALDSTGEGGGLKAIFDMEWGPVMGIEFGGAPSDTVVEAAQPPYNRDKTARDVYDRRVSELNHTVREFAIGNGIRGLSQEACDQACDRKTVYRNKKRTVESKKDMKARGSASPDNLDAVCVGCAYVQSQGARPGGAVLASRKMHSVMKKLAEEGAAMINESSYLIGQF